MATLAELYSFGAAALFSDRISSAVVIQANEVRAESGATANHAKRMILAQTAFQDPRALSQRFLWAMLAANAGATTQQIQNADDATIQAAVAAAWDVVAGI